MELLPPDTDPLQRGTALRWLSRAILDEAGAGEVALEAVRVLEPAGPRASSPRRTRRSPPTG